MARITRVRANTVIIAAARQNRLELTPAEKILWEVLRDRRFHGLKFRKQHPLGNYVLDFYCLEEKLILEIDGRIHDDPEQHALDEERTRHLSQAGNRMLRFANTVVIEDLPNVLAQIYAFLVNHPIHNIQIKNP